MHDTAKLPAFFGPLLKQQYGEADVQRILEGCAVRRATTLRANTLKATRDEVACALDAADLHWQPVGWYEDAFVLDGSRDADVRALAAYDEGKLYLQSLSSMVPALVLGARAGEDVCDMCAAPGGKTTQIAALSGGKALVMACEMHAPRAERLQHNLRKLGAQNVNVMRTDARRLDDFFSFDRILLDAPCSGSGTLDVADPKMPKRFTPALVEKSAKAQRALMAKALKLLKPGGTLVYSTCSVLACENEDIVRAALKDACRSASFELQPVALPHAGDLAPVETRPHAGDLAPADDLPCLPTSLEGCLALCPTSLYEGFFVAKVLRTA